MKWKSIDLQLRIFSTDSKNSSLNFKRNRFESMKTIGALFSCCFKWRRLTAHARTMIKTRWKERSKMLLLSAYIDLTNGIIYRLKLCAKSYMTEKPNVRFRWTMFAYYTKSIGIQTQTQTHTYCECQTK